jgi:hypothetical protein
VITIGSIKELVGELECLRELHIVGREAPKKSHVFDSYIIEWASFKRRLAEAVAKCLMEIAPKIKSVYYIELSEDYAGRDIDLLVELDKHIQGNPSELKETLEAILYKIVGLIGLDMYKLTNAGSSLFEIHTSKEGIYGSKTLYKRAIHLISNEN